MFLDQKFRITISYTMERPNDYKIKFQSLSIGRYSGIMPDTK